MTTPQATTVRCPNCRQPVQANIYSIIDVGKQPPLKDALLRGQINAINCPHCGYRGMVGNPVLYHDPAKQLALVLMPMELGLKRDEEERQIGKLTNALIESTPQEQRKMYMFQPKTMLTWQRLTEAILEADGITKEMLDKQAAQVRLLEDLLKSAGSEAEFKQAIEAHKDQINQEFVDLVAALAQSTASGGDQQGATQLLGVADTVARELQLKSPVGGPANADELIEEFLGVGNDDELREIVTAARPALDYAFYQALTSKIESSQGEEAAKLKELREKLLKLTDEIDREMESAMRSGTQLLQQILQSPNPKDTIRQNIERIDDSFMVVLQANLQQAAEQKQEQAMKALQEIYQEVVSQLEGRMPPDLKLVNQLLRFSPGDRAQYLREHANEITPEMLRTMAGLVNDLNASGRTEVANELRGLMNQIAAWQNPITTKPSIVTP
jgi:CpXC motif protein